MDPDPSTLPEQGPPGRHPSYLCASPGVLGRRIFAARSLEVCVPPSVTRLRVFLDCVSLGMSPLTICSGRLLGTGWLPSALKASRMLCVLWNKTSEGGKPSLTFSLGQHCSVTRLSELNSRSGRIVLSCKLVLGASPRLVSPVPLHTGSSREVPLVKGAVCSVRCMEVTGALLACTRDSVCYMFLMAPGQRKVGRAHGGQCVMGRERTHCTAPHRRRRARVGPSGEGCSCSAHGGACRYGGVRVPLACADVAVPGARV